MLRLLADGYEQYRADRYATALGSYRTALAALVGDQRTADQVADTLQRAGYRLMAAEDLPSRRLRDDRSARGSSSSPGSRRFAGGTPLRRPSAPPPPCPETRRSRSSCRRKCSSSGFWTGRRSARRPRSWPERWIGICPCTGRSGTRRGGGPPLQRSLRSSTESPSRRRPGQRRSGIPCSPSCHRLVTLGEFVDGRRGRYAQRSAVPTGLPWSLR